MVSIIKVSADDRGEQLQHTVPELEFWNGRPDSADEEGWHWLEHKGRRQPTRWLPRHGWHNPPLLGG